MLRGEKETGNAAEMGELKNKTKQKKLEAGGFSSQVKGISFRKSKETSTIAI